MTARVPASLSRRFGAVAASLARRDGAALPLRLTCPHARELGHLSRNFGRLPGGGQAFLEDVARRAAALLPQRVEELQTLVPALLRSDKAPKGFENFFKKGENGAKETPASDAKEETPAAPKVEKTPTQDSSGIPAGESTASPPPCFRSPLPHGGRGIIENFATRWQG